MPGTDIWSRYEDESHINVVNQKLTLPGLGLVSHQEACTLDHVDLTSNSIDFDSIAATSGTLV